MLQKGRNNMNMERAHRALEETARRHGITKEQVAAEIEETIAQVLARARKENDREILRQWEKIPCRGDVPDAYELVAYLGKKAGKEFY